MRKITLGLICLLACMAVAMPLAAQEGFPLKGSWLGDWGVSATSRNQVFIVFDWDGKVISGAINPGTEMIAIKNASLTPTAGAPPVPPVPAVPPAAGAPAAGGRGGGGGRGAAAPVAPTEWVVHFEGDGKDAKGATVHYVADGKVENIGLYNRSVTGTWVSGATKGTFKITRQ